MFTKESILEDLHKLDEYTILKKYLLNTDVWYFSVYHDLTEEELLLNIDSLYDIISSELSISMKNILLVSSSKTGFSFSPTKFMKEFDGDEKKASDIDIALIPEKYFEEYWNLSRKEKSIIYNR